MQHVTTISNLCRRKANRSKRLQETQILAPKFKDQTITSSPDVFIVFRRAIPSSSIGYQFRHFFHIIATFRISKRLARGYFCSVQGTLRHFPYGTSA